MEWAASSTRQTGSKEKWEEHREELCRLYQNMTLDDLMVLMKVWHRFAPLYGLSTVLAEFHLSVWLREVGLNC